MARSSFAIRQRSSAALRVCVATALVIMGALSSRAAFVLIRPSEAIRERELRSVQSAVESVEKAVEAARQLQDHQAEYSRNLPGPGVTYESWSTCSVEYQEDGRNVLEEWVMRGERQTVESFQNFRRSAASADAAVRCEETAPMASDAVTCIECVVADREGPKVLMQFGTLEQCMALSIGGNGFCRSGGVVAVMKQ